MPSGPYFACTSSRPSAAWLLAVIQAGVWHTAKVAQQKASTAAAGFIGRIMRALRGAAGARKICPQFYAGAREPAATGGEASAALGRPLVSAQDSASVRTPASAPVSPAPAQCGP